MVDNVIEISKIICEHANDIRKEEKKTGMYNVRITQLWWRLPLETMCESFMTTCVILKELRRARAVESR